MYRSQPPVQPSQCVGSHERHEQDARLENGDVFVLAKIEAADATEQQIADCKVEHPIAATFSPSVKKPASRDCNDRQFH